ncbi:MAG TPA: hypothetical protein VF459_06595 [Caulobacteraceae bacterium]
MKSLAIALLLSAAAVTVAHADEQRPVPNGGKHYAQHLVDVAKASHPQIASLSVYVARESGKPVIVLGSTAGGAGGAAPAAALAVIANSETQVHGADVWEPMKDVSGDTLGAIHVVFRAKTKDPQALAATLQAELGRRSLSAKNLYDPYPYDAGISDRNYAQALVDKTFAAHPELLVLAIHATPPGHKVNVIMGSSIGRIGKAADDDDLRVIDKGATNLEVAENGKRYEVELPLNDAAGKRIGALGCVFAYKPGDDKDALAARARLIRDEIASQTANPAALARRR